MQCNIKLINGRLAAALESLSSTLLAARQALTKDEAIAVNVAKLPKPVAQIRFPTAES